MYFNLELDYISLPYLKKSHYLWDICVILLDFHYKYSWVFL